MRRHALSEPNARRNDHGAEQELIICSLVEGRQETASVDLIFRCERSDVAAVLVPRRLHGPVHGRVGHTDVASLHSGMGLAVTCRPCRGHTSSSQPHRRWLLSVTEAQLHCEL